MAENISPWLNTPWIHHTYPILWEDIDADIVVVWWGIAWCVTAFSLLETTERNVVLVEWWKIAHGATWHNAWQIDVFFEKPLKEIVDTYGKDMAKKAYQAMFDAWTSLESVIEKIEWEGQYAKYIWYNAYTTMSQLLEVCEQLHLFDELWLEVNELFVCADSVQKDDIPEQYRAYVNWIDRAAWGKYLGSDSIDWICFEATHYGTLNSAALSYAIVQYLRVTYPESFAVYEQTPIASISVWDEHHMTLMIQKAENDSDELKKYQIKSQDIILCTNGYNTYTINDQQDALHTEAVTGCMVGYYIPEAKAPTTIGYQPATNSYTEDYYYHSARYFYDYDHTAHTLVSVWWPDLPEDTNDMTDEYKKDINGYIKKFYNHDIPAKYYRTGTMWYTDTWMRKIWPHPRYPHIFYNTWCNGVGILWSIHGGTKIVQYILGENLEKSVFDVYDNN